MVGRARLFRGFAVAFAVVSAALSAAAATFQNASAAAWLPVVTTVSAAVAAYAGSQRFDALGLEYARTAAQLDRLRLDQPPPTAGLDAVDRFVHGSEQVISIQ